MTRVTVQARDDDASRCCLTNSHHENYPQSCEENANPVPVLDEAVIGLISTGIYMVNLNHNPQWV